MIEPGHASVSVSVSVPGPPPFKIPLNYPKTPGWIMKFIAKCSPIWNMQMQRRRRRENSENAADRWPRRNKWRKWKGVTKLEICRFTQIDCMFSQNDEVAFKVTFQDIAIENPASLLIETYSVEWIQTLVGFINGKGKWKILIIWYLQLSCFIAGICFGKK